MKKRVNGSGMYPNGRGKKKSEPFVMALHAIMEHEDYIALSKTARAFLWELAKGYNGHNNGNISAAHGVMGALGWDKKTIQRCRRELEQRGWIVVTKYPSAKREPVLYRLGWLPVDKWTGKPILDPGAHAFECKSLRVKPWKSLVAHTPIDPI